MQPSDEDQSDELMAASKMLAYLCWTVGGEITLSGPRIRQFLLEHRGWCLKVSFGTEDDSRAWQARIVPAPCQPHAKCPETDMPS